MEKPGVKKKRRKNVRSPRKSRPSTRTARKAGRGPRIPLTGLMAVRKPVGPTSNQVAQRYARRWNTVVGHAGNLDPMAKGVLVLLIGREANRQQDRHKQADKDYRFEVLFGFSTDSHDVLGRVTGLRGYSADRLPRSRVKKAVENLIGRRLLTLPPFSHRKVRGRSLIWWARHERMAEISPPRRAARIDRAELRSLYTIGKTALRKRILGQISRVRGDFRQSAIARDWKTALDGHPNRRFTVAAVQLTCGKGTYIRSIAHRLGRCFGLPSLALGIIRTRNGPFRLSDCRRVRIPLGSP